MQNLIPMEKVGDESRTEDVDDDLSEPGSDELDDDSLASVAGGTNWHPEKDERKLTSSWESPDKW